jgi:hypothetical protein
LRDKEGFAYYRDHSGPFLHLLFQRSKYWKRLTLGFFSLVLVIAAPFFVFIVLGKNEGDKIAVYFSVFPEYFTSNSNVCKWNDPLERIKFEKRIKAETSTVLYFYEIESKKNRWKLEMLNPSSFLVSNDCAKMEVTIKKLDDTERIQLEFMLSQYK